MEQITKHAASLEAFAEVLVQLTGAIGSLAGIEEQKADAAANRQHARINGFLNPEQALLLKLRGMEQKRNRLAEQLGWKGLSFRQILEQADNEQQAYLSPRFTRLEHQIKRLTEAKELSDRIIQIRLKELNTAINHGDNQNYDSSKKTAAEPPLHLHDKYV